MSFRLCSQISIGKYAFSGGVNDIVIRRSIKEIVDTCTIKIPGLANIVSLKSAVADVLEPGITAVTRSNVDGLPAGSIRTSTLWQEGDKVNILLGYNNNYQQEFKGFVRRVSPSIPVVIECEGYGWQLRRKPFAGAWKSIKLLDLLTLIVSGTDVKLSPYIPDATLTGVWFKGENALSALGILKDKSHLSVFFYFDELYAGLEEIQPGKTIVQRNWRLGYNCPRTETLKYRIADTTNVQVRVTAARGKNLKTPILTVGDAGGSIITEHLAFNADPGQMTKIANQILLYKKYTGFEGTIRGFLQPYADPTDTANIVDKQYGVYTGQYFIDGTEVKFGVNGAQRIISISHSLNNPIFLALVNSSHQ